MILCVCVCVCPSVSVLGLRIYRIPLMNKGIFFNGRMIFFFKWLH